MCLVKVPNQAYGHGGDHNRHHQAEPVPDSRLPLRSQSSAVGTICNHSRGGGEPERVAMGGGTGASTLLRGLNKHIDNIATIVIVTDHRG